MEGMIDSAFDGWYFLLWEVLPSMVGLSFYETLWNFPVIGEYNIKILATSFSPLFLLHCDNQVAKIVTLIFSLFWLLQKRLLWIEMLKLIVEIVQLQEPNTIYLDTNCVAVLGHGFVLNVPISLLNQEMT